LLTLREEICFTLKAARVKLVHGDEEEPPLFEFDEPLLNEPLLSEFDEDDPPLSDDEPLLGEDEPPLSVEGELLSLDGAAVIDQPIVVVQVDILQLHLWLTHQDTFLFVVVEQRHKIHLLPVANHQGIVAAVDVEMDNYPWNQVLNHQDMFVVVIDSEMDTVP
jgi:hypothetical protein